MRLLLFIVASAAIVSACASSDPVGPENTSYGDLLFRWDEYEDYLQNQQEALETTQRRLSALQADSRRLSEQADQLERSNNAAKVEVEDLSIELEQINAAIENAQARYAALARTAGSNNSGSLSASDAQELRDLNIQIEQWAAAVERIKNKRRQDSYRY